MGLMSTDRGPYGNWLFEKFREWEHSTGDRQTYTRFAKWLGVANSHLSNYINGKDTPGEDNALLIALKLGFESYQFLKFDPPGPTLRYVIKQWDRLTPEEQKAIMAQVEGFVSEGERDNDRQQSEAAI